MCLSVCVYGCWVRARVKTAKGDGKGSMRGLYTETHMCLVSKLVLVRSDLTQGCWLVPGRLNLHVKRMDTEERKRGEDGCSCFEARETDWIEMGCMDRVIDGK